MTNPIIIQTLREQLTQLNILNAARCMTKQQRAAQRLIVKWLTHQAIMATETHNTTIINDGNTTTTDERQMDVENIYLFLEQYRRSGIISPLQNVPHWIDNADVQDSIRQQSQ